MRRDWGVIKLILEALEEKPSTDGLLHPKEIKGYAEEVVSYHMLNMHEAGLIEARCREHSNTGVFCLAARLTWEGHELLDIMRSKGLWGRLKGMLLDGGMEVSLVAIKTVIAEAIKRGF